MRGNPINRIDPSGYQTGVGEVALGGGVFVTCVAGAPACAAALTAGAVFVGFAAAGIIIYVSVDYLIQHPELGEVTYPAGQPVPLPAPAPPQAPPLIGTPPAPPFVSADGTRPISAVPGRQSGDTPEPERTSIPAPVPTPHPPATCTPTSQPEEQIWRAISTAPNRASFNWQPTRDDFDGLLGTRGGTPPYHTDPALWFQTTIGRGRPPGPTDRIMATIEDTLRNAGFSVENTPIVGEYPDPWHVSIGGKTPGIVQRGQNLSWAGSKSDRKRIRTTLESSFNIQVWP